MLEAITIYNFALISELVIEFEPGLNILTGETGAGKSIIIDALGMALGERASTEFLRTGASSGRIEAVFAIVPDSHLPDILDKHGISCADNRIILARELNASGRNYCRVNGHLVTTVQLKEIAQHLVDIHGQHQHQSLLHPGTHLSFLDAFGGPDQLALTYKVHSLYSRYNQLLTKLENHDKTVRARAQRVDMLQYQIEDIEASNLTPGEQEDLLQERELLQQRESLLEAVGNAYTLLYGRAREKGAIDFVGEAQIFLEQAATTDKQLAAAAESLAGTLYNLQDMVPKLRQYQENFPQDPKRLVEVEERLNLIRTLMRKYGNTIDDILAYRDNAVAELEGLQQEEADRGTLAQELSQVKEKLTDVAGQLADRRRQLATVFEQQLAEELTDLGMEKAQIKVAFSTEEDAVHGLDYKEQKLRVYTTGFDRVEFLLMANPGETPKPLAKIASGGEIARVMLAIKTVLAGADAVPTLIFDEVDAGIGGRAAQKVATKLTEVSRFHQVICVTHLPQIAAAGSTHFYIYKKTVDGKTYTKVDKLSSAARVQEISRMLAGTNITPIVLQHAKQLLEQTGTTKS